MKTYFSQSVFLEQLSKRFSYTVRVINLSNPIYEYIINIFRKKQKKAGKNPVFTAKNIGLDETDLVYWKEADE